MAGLTSESVEGTTHSYKGRLKCFGSQDIAMLYQAPRTKSLQFLKVSYYLTEKSSPSARLTLAKHTRRPTLDAVNHKTVIENRQHHYARSVKVNYHHYLLLFSQLGCRLFRGLRRFVH